MFNCKLVSAALIASTVVLVSTTAIADTPWQKDHPRREQVNNRLAYQNQRITHERKEGEITKAQARALRSTDRSIRAQERADAATHNGHITKAEQQILNQELNANSRAIGK